MIKESNIYSKVFPEPHFRELQEFDDTDGERK